MNKIFYFKNKRFDFRIKIFFLEIRLYFGSFVRLIFSLFKLYNYVSLFRIYKNNNKGNILIIEMNDFHSEIFPSWLFYLKELSYKNSIYFLAPNYIHKIKPFNLLAKQENHGYLFYKMDPKIILTCFNLGLFRKYKKVIFNSDIFYSSFIDQSYSYLLDGTKRKDIFHNAIITSHLILQTMSSNKNNFINTQNQLITTSPSISKDTNIKYVLPLFNKNLYGKTTEKRKTFQDQKTFVSCGSIKISEKDSESLFNSLNQLKEYKKKINIIGKSPKHIINDFSHEINYYKKRISCSSNK